MGKHCREDCDSTLYWRDDQKMECNCMDPANEYFRTEYDETTGERIGGECTDLPNCTAGTFW